MKRPSNHSLALLAALAALATALANTAQAQVVLQPYPYPGAPTGWVMPASGAYVYGYAPCPEPAPVVEGEGSAGGVEMGIPETLPEIADFGADVVYASAPQTAVPNAIGDSMGGCGLLLYDDGIGLGPDVSLDICPAGGRKFKATHNNSPVPRSRVFYTYNHFDDALGGTLDGNRQIVNVDRHEIGYERAIWCGLASMQLNVPFSNTIDSDLNQTVLQTLPRDTELGNVSVAFKAVVYQDCYKTFSMGLGIDIPTADDVEVQNANAFFAVENETVTLSPFVGWLVELTPNLFTQGFVQVALPVNANEATVNIFGVDSFEQEVSEMSMLYVDLSTGLWIYRDQCTGNGIAAIAEFHYTTAFDHPEFVTLQNGGEFLDFSYFRRDIMNVTLGTTVVRNCWDGTVAAVLPLTDRPDRFFDWEVAVQVNRRF